MDAAEYDLPYFHRAGFTRRVCGSCGSAFWSLGPQDRCSEVPCTPYSFLGDPGFRTPYSTSEMREKFLTFFERSGHTRIRRYPIVARWRNDVFFTQASIYDFQPWVTSGEIPPPANPLTLSQPCLRFNDLPEVGRSGRHLTLFEMMAHHAFNSPGHEVYFKDRTAEYCQEFLTAELGADPLGISYKEEEWEGGGNLGPSFSVGLRGVELATLVFMEYLRDGDRLKPMPLTVVDTGYGLERFTWMSRGTTTAYEAIFGEPYAELRAVLSPEDSAVLVDHARSVNLMITDGVVPSNAREGYYARLLLRRMMRTIARTPGAPDLVTVIDRVGRAMARDLPEVGAHRDDLRKIVEAERDRFEESIQRGRVQARRLEERLARDGRTVGVDELVEWYDSLGLPPDLAVTELQRPPAIPDDFFARVAARHLDEARETDYRELAHGAPEPAPSTPATAVEYYLDPYTVSFRAHVAWTDGPWVVLDRTYFYPTGGGQLHDTGHLDDVPVVDVVRRGPWVLHRLERLREFPAGTEVHGRIDEPRRRQLMQHHTATHIVNGALRKVLGPHVWQAGAYKGPELARIDVTHYRPLAPAELHEVERMANRVVSDDRPVKSYFEPRTEAERRFGFTLYQGGAVPGKELRIVEVEGFDVEACGGTHCTHTSEVGTIQLLATERIQDGIVRLSYVAGDRAVVVREEHEAALQTAARRLGVPPEKLPEAVERLLEEREATARASRRGAREDVAKVADDLLADASALERAGPVSIVAPPPFDWGAAQLQELARRLTRSPGTVAILGGTAEGRGLVFVGSSAPSVPADRVLEPIRARFGGKGGGNATAATAQGEPGEPLVEALAAGRDAARALAGASER